MILDILDYRYTYLDLFDIILNVGNSTHNSNCNWSYILIFNYYLYYNITKRDDTCIWIHQTLIYHAP